MKMTPYQRLALALSLSFVIMYIVMYFNVYSLDHIFFSTTRLYMTFLMVMPMAWVMLFVMKKMFENQRVNRIILTTAAGVFVLAFVLMRTQTPIADEAYMRAMIPHHSIAILTSERADIRDPEVKKLAEEIIRSQQEEIAEMKRLLKRMND